MNQAGMTPAELAMSLGNASLSRYLKVCKNIPVNSRAVPLKRVSVNSGSSSNVNLRFSTVSLSSAIYVLWRSACLFSDERFCVSICSAHHSVTNRASTRGVAYLLVRSLYGHRCQVES